MAKKTDPTQIEITLPSGISQEDRLAIADEIIEYICQENNQYGVAGGYIQGAK